MKIWNFIIDVAKCEDWNEEEYVPQKCTFCAPLLDEGWKQPRCAQSCPTGALKAVKAEDNPRVYYKNLYRYSHCFIGGERGL
ncbi:MAG TPA: hypothetical protein ENO25_06845 [Desulfobacteraceae bacterium]|nr:hypothetical protein [Desulfobacteraceae bacterium]